MVCEVSDLACASLIDNGQVGQVVEVGEYLLERNTNRVKRENTHNRFNNDA